MRSDKHRREGKAVVEKSKQTYSSTQAKYSKQSTAVPSIRKMRSHKNHTTRNKTTAAGAARTAAPPRTPYLRPSRVLQTPSHFHQLPSQSSVTPTTLSVQLFDCARQDRHLRSLQIFDCKAKAAQFPICLTPARQRSTVAGLQREGPKWRQWRGMERCTEGLRRGNRYSECRQDVAQGKILAFLRCAGGVFVRQFQGCHMQRFPPPCTIYSCAIHAH